MTNDNIYNIIIWEVLLNFTVKFGKQDKIKERVYIPSSDLRGKKVLVVDDNDIARAVLKEYLENFTFTVSEVESGKKALEEIENNSKKPGAKPYELILMDWNMPGMDGIETAVRIKDNHKIKHQPIIIMVTAFGREEIMKSADDAGIDSFLIKPVGQSVLFDTIMSVFGKEVEIKKEDLGKKGGF